MVNIVCDLLFDVSQSYRYLILEFLESVKIECKAVALARDCKKWTNFVTVLGHNFSVLYWKSELELSTNAKVSKVLVQKNIENEIHLKSFLPPVC